MSAAPIIRLTARAGALERGLSALESDCKTHVEAGDVEAALRTFEWSCRRTVPHKNICAGLLELCAMRAPRRCAYVLESMGDVRQLDVDDYCRIVRLFLMQRVEVAALEHFDELAIDTLAFSDDGMHNYFAHLATLLNLELHEAVSAAGAAGGGPSGAEHGMEVSLLTHKRQLEAAALLCKRGGTITPLFAILLVGMGGREGAQDVAEARQLASSTLGLAAEHLAAKARGEIEALPSLNASQKAAASACVDRRLTLVQGPPGTGKTTVAVQVLLIWVRTLGLRPVMACADSNVAVDNIGVALLEAGLNVVRTGRADAIAPALLGRMPDALGGPACLAEADVLLCTCVGAGAELVRKHCGSPGAILIDEVAQSTEPSTLVPLTLGCRQLVLVGDHKQLRPTVLSDAAASRGLQLSLFERLIRHGVEPLLLDTQYRMHPSLAAFPSQAFYAGRVASGIDEAARPRLRGFAWPSSRTAAALVPSSAPEEASGGRSKRNPGEAGTVASILRGVLLAGELSANQIGVITPYAAQVALIRQSLASVPDGRRVEVKTVDGFQGREKELIVFSAVRAGRGGALGFVSDARRLNVMLTRARRGLIVVGEPRTLVNSRHWAEWLAWIEAQRAACASPGWRMPPRPSRVVRSRSSSPDNSEVDELGRGVRRSPSKGRLPNQRGRAKRRDQRKAKRAATAGAAGEEDEEARWRRTLRVAAEDGEVRDGVGPAPKQQRATSAAGEPLLPNWYYAEDAQGALYFHNRATLEVCWDAPTNSVANKRGDP